MRELAERKVAPKEAEAYFDEVFGNGTAGSSKTVRPPVNYAFHKALALYRGEGRGSDLASSKGTAWGLLNAVTEYVDHEKRARSVDHRLDWAWFGQGAGIKHRALNAALKLVA
jgi:hypothetical protein